MTEYKASAIGITLDALAATIAARREAGPESYTYQLLTAGPDKALKKVAEEAVEVGLAAKDLEAALSSVKAHQAVAQAYPDAALALEGAKERTEKLRSHLRYESADVVYHLLVVLERYGISLDDLAAELNSRMTDQERPAGAATFTADQINRGRE